MNPAESFAVDKRRVRAAFDAAAGSYPSHAALHQEIGRRLLERLGYIHVQPGRIVDLGCGPGLALKPLSRLYRGSQVCGLDLAEDMARRARGQWRWPRRPLAVCADMEQIPLAAASFDLAVSVSALQWLNDLDQAFREVRRILAPGGLWMFTTLGPDTLRELRTAFRLAAGDDAPRVNAFIDMHDVGDALLRAGFSDPVMDQEVITVTYPDFATLLRDLRGAGVRNAMRGRSRGLFGPRRLQAAERLYREHFVREARWPLTWEVVYGHAWVPSAPAPSHPSGTFIPITPVD